LPILEVVALPQEPPVDVPAVLGELCGAVAAAADCPERQVFATWRTIPDGHYVEGRVDAATQPRDTHPPLVRLQALRGRSPETIRAMLAAAAQVLGSSLEIDQANVFIHYEELLPGRTHAGGSILE
jgi:hypothetical protein